MVKPVIAMKCNPQMATANSPATCRRRPCVDSVSDRMSAAMENNKLTPPA